jgi:hypothetical protein
MRGEPRVVLRDRIEGAGTHTIVWRWHLDPAVTAELVGSDCRLVSDQGEVWFLPIDTADEILRIERGWVSPSYGVRHEASLLVLERRGPVPVSRGWIFAEARLPIADRQRALDLLDRLDREASRAHSRSMTR